MPLGYPVLLLFPGHSLFHEYLHPTCSRMDLPLPQGRCILVGQLTKSVPVLPLPGVKIIGVHFHPLFFGMTGMSPIVDTFVEISGSSPIDWDGWCKEERNASEDPDFATLFSMLEAWLLPKLSGSAVPAALLSLLASWQERRGLVEIEESASIVGYSPRSLQRALNKYLGYTPKQYTRILRQQLILELVRADGYTLKSASELAEYFDHSHFHKDFKALTGITPNEFMANAHMGQILGSLPKSH